MIKAALDDAGLSIEDVDGVCHTQSSMVLAEYLRIVPHGRRRHDPWVVVEVHAQHAAAAIAAGLCD